MKSRIMYIEDKSNGLVGEARIGRVTFSKSGKTIYYKGKSFKYPFYLTYYNKTWHFKQFIIYFVKYFKDL